MSTSWLLPLYLTSQPVSVCFDLSKIMGAFSSPKRSTPLSSRPKKRRTLRMFHGASGLRDFCHHRMYCRRFDRGAALALVYKWLSLLGMDCDFVVCGAKRQILDVWSDLLPLLRRISGSTTILWDNL